MKQSSKTLIFKKLWFLQLLFLPEITIFFDASAEPQQEHKLSRFVHSKFQNFKKFHQTRENYNNQRRIILLDKTVSPIATPPLNQKTAGANRRARGKIIIIPKGKDKLLKELGIPKMYFTAGIAKKNQDDGGYTGDGWGPPVSYGGGNTGFGGGNGWGGGGFNSGGHGWGGGNFNPGGYGWGVGGYGGHFGGGGWGNELSDGYFGWGSPHNGFSNGNGPHWGWEGRGRRWGGGGCERSNNNKKKKSLKKKKPKKNNKNWIRPQLGSRYPENVTTNKRRIVQRDRDQDQEQDPEDDLSLGKDETWPNDPPRQPQSTEPTTYKIEPMSFNNDQITKDINIDFNTYNYTTIQSSPTTSSEEEDLDPLSTSQIIQVNLNNSEENNDGEKFKLPRSDLPKTIELKLLCPKLRSWLKSGQKVPSCVYIQV